MTGDHFRQGAAKVAFPVDFVPPAKNTSKFQFSPATDAQ